VAHPSALGSSHLRVDLVRVVACRTASTARTRTNEMKCEADTHMTHNSSEDERRSFKADRHLDKLDSLTK